MEGRRWFYRSDDEWIALAERLKLIACPHCHVAGTLIRHGILTGFDEASPPRITLRARRIFCSNRRRRPGCGRTISVWIAAKIRRLSLTTRTLFHFLRRVLLEWEQTVADTRLHGTTRKQVAAQFALEKPALRPLPNERFPCFREVKRKVHRDGHVEVEKAYYSVPPEFLSRPVWVRYDSRLVRIFDERMKSIAVHVRHEPGRFSTQSSHIAGPKISGVERGTEWLLGRVRRVGPHSLRWAEGVIANRGIEGVRVLQGLLNLAQRHPCEALERACDTAVSHGSDRLRTIRKLLERPTPRQESLPFLTDHPVIRNLTDYGQFVHDSFHKEVE